MKRLTACILGLGLIVGLTGQVQAEPFGFGVNGDDYPDVLFRVDLATGNATNIGNGLGSQFTDVEGLAFDPNTGILYGIDDRDDALLTINTTTGFGKLVGSLRVSVIRPGLAISPSGIGFIGESLWADELFSVNLGTGEATLVGEMGVEIDGLAFLGNILYGINPKKNALYTLNTTNGKASLVGILGPDIARESGLATDGTYLYAGDDDGQYLRINPTTGEATVITSNGRKVEGLAIQPNVAPVPEPSTMILLGTGLASIIAWRRKTAA